jgi:hypothetical protein
MEMVLSGEDWLKTGTVEQFYKEGRPDCAAQS